MDKRHASICVRPSWSQVPSVPVHPLDPELRSRPTSKNILVALGGGVTEITIRPERRRTREHHRRPRQAVLTEEVVYWKAHWTDWLQALEKS